jgi:hypothetical protein
MVPPITNSRVSNILEQQSNHRATTNERSRGNEMSELGQLVTNTSNMTLDSAITTVRSFKLDSVQLDNDYNVGYNEGIEAAIKAIQLFQSALKEQAPKLND